MNRTRTVIISVTALGLAMLLVPSAHAQDAAAAQQPAGQGRGQRGNRPVTAATMPISAIHAVVTLTADEKAKIETIQATYKTDIAAATGDQQKSRDVRTKANDDIKAALTTDQAAKLTETLPAVSMLAQSRAVPVAVLAAVKLTAEQWTKIKAAAKDGADKIAAADQADRRTVRTTVNMEFKTTVDALLTAEQKEIIAKAAAPASDPAAPATKVL